MRREVVHGVHSMHSMECMDRRTDHAAVVRGRWFSRGNDQSESRVPGRHVIAYIEPKIIFKKSLSASRE